MSDSVCKANRICLGMQITFLAWYYPVVSPTSRFDNAFVRSGEYAKQVPLAYVLMSSKKARDYKKVCSLCS